jgi:hypothetical protein
MPSRPPTRSAGEGAPPFLLFAFLLVLVALSAAVAWWVLSGEAPPAPPIQSAEPMRGPGTQLEPAPSPESEPLQAEVDDETFSKQLIEMHGKTFPGKDLTGRRIEDVTLHPLEGTVVDDRQGDPVYYFWVYLIPTEMGDARVARNSWSPSHFRNGQFRLQHQPAGSFHLVVESREHEPVYRTIQVPYEGRLEIRLHHGSCIRGIVRDTNATPLRDIEIQLGVDPAKIDGGAAPPMQRLVKTDDLGRYSFWKVPAGSYSLSARLMGDELDSMPEFRLDPGGEVLRDFTLERLGSLKLTVINAVEQPVPRARVMLLQEKDGRDRTVRTAYADLKGVARLDFVREGSYKLRVVMQGFQPHEEPVAVAAGERFRELPVRLEVAPRRQ